MGGDGHWGCIGIFNRKSDEQPAMRRESIAMRGIKHHISDAKKVLPSDKLISFIRWLSLTGLGAIVVDLPCLNRICVSHLGWVLPVVERLYVALWKRIFSSLRRTVGQSPRNKNLQESRDFKMSSTYINIANGNTTSHFVGILWGSLFGEGRECRDDQIDAEC